MRPSALAERILACRRCPRLLAYHRSIAREHPDWHCKPVPGWGDARAAVVLIGLAPSKTGGNRTGRIFTGDRTGDFLFRALYETGFCNQPASTGMDDGLALDGIYLTPAVKCAPPKDKPTPTEVGNCAPFLGEELARLAAAKVVVALGRLAHDAYLRFAGQALAAWPFVHGRAHRLGRGPTLLDTYHCSPRNTNTGLLTMKMLVGVLAEARRLARA